MRRPSLTVQILAGVGLPFLVVAALIAVLAYSSADNEISEAYDAQLMTSAVQLWTVANTYDHPTWPDIDRSELGLDAENLADLEEFEFGRSFRVWKNGTLEMASRNAPSPSVGAGPRGLRTVQEGHRVWRVFTLVSPQSHIVVEVRERLHERNEISGRIVWELVWPLLTLLPIIGLAVWFGIRGGLKDLRDFAGQVQTRSPNDLTRIDGGRMPGELSPLSDAINGLLGKLETSLAQERLFTDNAAHELRTPLAALNIQAEIARNARTAKERKALLDELSLGVGRTARLLDQLLTLARLHHMSEEAHEVNLYAVATEVLKDAYPKANARRIELSLSGDETVLVPAAPTLLTLLIGNLVDNAIKYSPEGGSVEMRIEREAAETVLILSDQGPGIPEIERDRVFGRFYRSRGNTAPGSGLGLSIVRSISEILQARVTLFTPHGGRGLGVEVRIKL